MVRQLLEQAIADFGSEAKLAAACGVKQPSIHQAKMLGRCSAGLALRIQRASGGKYRARDLAPNEAWPDEAPLVPAQSPDLEKAS